MAKNVPAIVFTGGGARAAYQVGVVKALAEIFPSKQSPFPIICGTSAGAINATYLAAKADNWPDMATSLVKFWSELKMGDVYRSDITRLALRTLTRLLHADKKQKTKANYFLNTDPLKKILHEEINFSAIQGHIEAGVIQAICCSAVHYDSGMTVSFYSGNKKTKAWKSNNRVGFPCELSAQHVLASSAIPMFFPPVKIEDKYFGDGCLHQNTPLSPAIHLGADRILCIGIRSRHSAKDFFSSTESRRQSPSFAKIAGELLNSIFLDDLEPDVERMQRINDHLAALPKSVRTKIKTIREIPVYQICPSKNLNRVVPALSHYYSAFIRSFFLGLGVSRKEGNELLSYLTFLGECTQPFIELGYEDTMNQKKELQRFMKA